MLLHTLLYYHMYERCYESYEGYSERLWIYQPYVVKEKGHTKRGGHQRTGYKEAGHTNGGEHTGVGVHQREGM